MARPVMIVVAGPPGSGKTTFFSVDGFGVDCFNVDDRCAQLVGGYPHIPPRIAEAVAQLHR